MLIKCYLHELRNDENLCDYLKNYVKTLSLREGYKVTDAAIYPSRPKKIATATSVASQ